MLEEKHSSKSKKSQEAKGKWELGNALLEAHHKLFDSKAQVAMAIQEGVEAYKLFEDCCNEKIEFSTKAYLIGKNEV